MDRSRGRLMAVIKPIIEEDFDTFSNTITLSASPGYSSMDYGAIPTISITDLTLGNITTTTGAVGSTSSNTYTLGSGGSHANAVWTTTGTGINWNDLTTSSSIGQGGKLALKGEGADIDINGKSMTAWMEKVEERLNILTPNPELEKEWDELRKLGERYRKLEKKCKEKAEMWNKLKSMPPPTAS